MQKTDISNTRKLSAIVSIHDVMPRTLTRVLELVSFLEERGINRFSLLVVPGKTWSPRKIEVLNTLHNQGKEIVGHGWRHRVYRVNNLRHRLHGKIISRDEAEHLSLSEREISGIINRCFKWFGGVSITAPRVYVPPAWAMGDISRKTLRALPFELYETQCGLYHARTLRFVPMPVIGYMADTPTRVRLIKWTNTVNLRIPLSPTRIAIHPDDLYLPLVNDLETHLGFFRKFITYNDLFERAPDGDPAANQ